MAWEYLPFADAPRPSELQFVVDPELLEYERPPSFAEWCEAPLEPWALAEREIAAVLAAGPRRGGQFLFPNGTGPASDWLIAIYDVLEADPASAVRICERRVTELPEELDAWCMMSNVHLEAGEPERGLNAALAGVAIGETALPPAYGGVAIHGMVDNRPFLRCLGSAGLSAQALGDLVLAERFFTTLLWLDVYDHVGARFDLHNLRATPT